MFLPSSGDLSKNVLTFKNPNPNPDIYVTDYENNLFSRTMAEKMNQIKLNIQEIQRPKQFGLMKGERVKIQLREGAVPFHCNIPQRVPIQPLKFRIFHGSKKLPS